MLSKYGIICAVLACILSVSGCAAEPIENTDGAQTVTAEHEVPDGEIDFSKYADLSKKAIGWGIKKNKGAAPDIPADVAEMTERYDAWYMDFKNEKNLYLTFDEGYENGYTAQILDVLKEEGVTAAFFVTGPYLKKETELVRRMIDEGHIVGNHTVNHPNLAKLSPEKMREEVQSLSDMFAELYDGEMKYVRPPEGAYSEQVLALMKDMGYKTVFWSFAYKDWDPDEQKGADYAFKNVTEYLHDGSVILLHAVSKDNADALRSIIQYAKNNGYTFKSLNEL